MKTTLHFFMAKKKLGIFIYCCWMLLSYQAMAQTDFVKVFNTSQSDFTKLLDAYYTPLSKALGTSLNNGWSNTAEPMRLGRFDIRILASTSLVPTKDQSIDLKSIGLSNAITFPNNQSTTAGIFSSNKGIPIQYYPAGVDTTTATSASITLPDGVGINALPIPMLQFNLGLLWGTELSVRLIPAIPVENGQNISDDSEGRTKVGMWGVGFKHDFQQWIPGFNLWPVKFSLAVGFTRAKLQANTALIPDNANLVLQGGTVPPDVEKYANQNLEFTSSSFYTGLLFSRKFPLITFYGGVRAEASSTSFKIKGTYPITVEDDDPNSTTFGQNIVFELNNPYSVSRAFSQISFNLGMRLKLGVFSLFADYSQGTQQYQNITVGFGFGLFDN